MKILHVETGMNLYGGAQQVAFLLAGMAQQGHQNILVCPPGSAIGQHFANSKIQLACLPCSGDVDIAFLFRLRKVIKAHKPDVVHLHSRRGADVLGGLAAKLEGIPCVLSRRVDNPEPRWWAAIKYRLYDRVICISQGIADVLAELGVPHAQLRAVRSSVDPGPWQNPESREKFCAEFGTSTDAVLVGVVAQLIERKGHRVLFDALRKLPASSLSSVQVVCFGKGPLRQALEQDAQDLENIVRFAGFRDDLPRWIGALDLLVHPAFMEGLGVSLLQASAAGVPIITSRAGGLPEAVKDGVSGVLVAPGDSNELAQVFKALCDDPVKRKQLGAQGRARIEQAFSVAKMVEGNLAVYKEIIR